MKTNKSKQVSSWCFLLQSFQISQHSTVEAEGGDASPCLWLTLKPPSVVPASNSLFPSLQWFPTPCAKSHPEVPKKMANQQGGWLARHVKNKPRQPKPNRMLKNHPGPSPTMWGQELRMSWGCSSVVEHTGGPGVLSSPLEKKSLHQWPLVTFSVSAWGHSWL